MPQSAKHPTRVLLALASGAVFLGLSGCLTVPEDGPAATRGLSTSKKVSLAQGAVRFAPPAGYCHAAKDSSPEFAILAHCGADPHKGAMMTVVARTGDAQARLPSGDKLEHIVAPQKILKRLHGQNVIFVQLQSDSAPMDMVHTTYWRAFMAHDRHLIAMAFYGEIGHSPNAAPLQELVASIRKKSPQGRAVTGKKQQSGNFFSTRFGHLFNSKK